MSFVDSWKFISQSLALYLQDTLDMEFDLLVVWKIRIFDFNWNLSFTEWSWQNGFHGWLSTNRNPRTMSQLQQRQQLPLQRNRATKLALHSKLQHVLLGKLMPKWPCINKSETSLLFYCIRYCYPRRLFKYKLRTVFEYSVSDTCHSNVNFDTAFYSWTLFLENLSLKNL